MQGAHDPQGDGAVQWSAHARASFDQTIDRVSAQDSATAHLIVERVLRAISQISSFPNIGTRTTVPDVLRFPIPQTGHAIEYRIVNGKVRILRWFRQRRRS